MDQPSDRAPELVILFSGSQTLDGCDRVMLVGDEIIVQGKPALGRADLASISVPADETLSAIGVGAFLAAARALEMRLNSS